MPTIFLLGDSTVEDNKEPFRGWGFAIGQFTAEGVKVENHAISGYSTKSFLQEGKFDAVRERMSAGDLLMIQFGHNDEKDDEERHTDPHTSFVENLSTFCDAAIEKGTQPVLCTPVSRRYFVGHTSLLYTHGEYAGAVRALAQKRELPMCDLEAMTRKLYLKLGEEATAKLFVQIAKGEHPDFPDGHDDMTHFNATGAKVIAKLVAEWMAQNEACKAFVDASKLS